MKAKFRCSSVNNFEHGETVTFYPTPSDSANGSWAYSRQPNGELKIRVEVAGARGQFVPGADYVLELTRVEAA